MQVENITNATVIYTVTVVFAYKNEDTKMKKTTILSPCEELSIDYRRGGYEISITPNGKLKVTRHSLYSDHTTTQYYKTYPQLPTDWNGDAGCEDPSITNKQLFLMELFNGGY